MSDYLNIAENCKKTRVLGPGIRYVLWLQGCPFKCKKCISPEWIPIKPANLVSIDHILDEIFSDDQISGITISGGEPFLQSRNLFRLLKMIHDEKENFNVITFTGFNYSSLNWQDAKDFLSEIDVLISGPYEESLNDGIGLRGSSNQEIHFLTDRLVHEKPYFFDRRNNLEYHIKSDGVLIVGIPKSDFNF